MCVFFVVIPLEKSIVSRCLLLVVCTHTGIGHPCCLIPEVGIARPCGERVSTKGAKNEELSFAGATGQGGAGKTSLDLLCSGSSLGRPTNKRFWLDRLTKEAKERYSMHTNLFLFPVAKTADPRVNQSTLQRSDQPPNRLTSCCCLVPAPPPPAPSCLPSPALPRVRMSTGTCLDSRGYWQPVSVFFTTSNDSGRQSDA